MTLNPVPNALGDARLASEKEYPSSTLALRKSSTETGKKVSSIDVLLDVRSKQSARELYPNPICQHAVCPKQDVVIAAISLCEVGAVSVYKANLKSFAPLELPFDGIQRVAHRQVVDWDAEQADIIRSTGNALAEEDRWNCPQGNSQIAFQTLSFHILHVGFRLLTECDIGS